MDENHRIGHGPSAFILSQSNSIPLDSVRLDKWLWAARFFKTRALATEAITGGKVHLNGSRIKPARQLKPEDELRIRKGEMEWTVIVKELSDKRGPASVAQTLYEETPASIEARQAAAEQRRLLNEQMGAPPRRPDKRARRQIHRFIRRTD
ncbi:MAG: RNA-binding S4 domain-containing protein [Gammaproteobacteria bacterium]